MRGTSLKLTFQTLINAVLQARACDMQERGNYEEKRKEL